MAQSEQMQNDPPPSGQRADHWRGVYGVKQDDELSWFQAQPQPSLDLIRSVLPAGGRVIDIGGGTSELGARLAASPVASGRGFDVSVLDIAPEAIARAKARAGAIAKQMRWIVADVLRPGDLGTFDLWHDRAVLHFLTDEAEQAAYVAAATRSVSESGHLVIGAFAMTGPERCSGLPVRRHDEASLVALFAESFTLVRSLSVTHHTPWGAAQDFVFVVLRRFV